MIFWYDNDMRPPVSLARVTATLPRTLVEAADRLARHLGSSRSALLAEALRAFLREGAPGRNAGTAVGEAVAAPYAVDSASPLADAGDGALLAEVARRLARRSDAATGPAHDTPAGTPQIHVDRDLLADLCRRHHIRRLSLFGSVLRDDFGPTSDVDVLVEFEPGRTIGFDIVTVEEEL